MRDILYIRTYIICKIYVRMYVSPCFRNVKRNIVQGIIIIHPVPTK